MGTTSPHQHHHSLTKKFISRALYVLLPLALLHFYLSPFSSQQTQLNSNTTHSQGIIHAVSPSYGSACNYTDGRWVPSKAGPLYNGTSCGTIKDGQNCMAHGRPDAGYLHWRWQPRACKLSSFSPLQFLRKLRHKHLAFVGDSMARNQLESLLCLLSSASPPEPVPVRRGGGDDDEGRFRRWVFRHFNATVSVYWSPFLVKGREKSAAGGLDHNDLHLDSADERWASELGGMDVVVFSVGHWFLHPAIYHEGGRVIGRHHCPEHNHTEEIGFFGVFRKAVRTALREVGLLAEESEKLVVVTTFSPAHFEGEWDKAGACPKREPYREREMEYVDAEMRKIEVEEVAAMASAGGGGGGKMRIEALDVTKLALLRPDGHPGPYMYPNPFADGPRERVQNDCVHWCLPGPIDTWNEILLEMVKRWKN